MKLNTKLPILFLTVIILSGCGPSWHLKQSKRHKLKAIQLGAVVKVDTVFTEKTVITKEVKTDTLFKDVLGDTVYITKDNLKIKYVRMPGDTVFISGKAERDTLKILVPTTVTEVIHSDKVWAKWWIFLIAGLVVGITLWLRR